MPTDKSDFHIPWIPHLDYTEAEVSSIQHNDFVFIGAFV